MADDEATAARRWETPGQRFGRMLGVLVAHNGLEAEAELIDLLGKARLKSLYDGDEPRLGELIEIARILNVPLTTFQIVEPGAFPELEIAFADVLRAARGLDPARRQELAGRITELAGWARQDQLGSTLPDSLLNAVRRATR